MALDGVRSERGTHPAVMEPRNRSTEAPAAHKQTAHYQRWAETVADMMAVPRFSVKFDKVYPEAEHP